MQSETKAFWENITNLNKKLNERRRELKKIDTPTKPKVAEGSEAPDATKEEIEEEEDVEAKYM